MAHRRAAWSKGIMDDFVASGESAAEVTQGVDGKPFATPRDVVRHATMLRNHYNKPEYRGVRVMQRRNRLFVVKEDKK
ncbi:MAG: hypothetical protein HFJ75_07585 [Eggerthellaceae bacterium]|nr:hypothetical protein [Eggerthellaceae bacterium]